MIKPNRVMVDETGRALSPARAKRDYGRVPVIVLEREDGWRLGAPRGLVEYALGTWSGYWVKWYDDNGEHAMTDLDLDVIERGTTS